MCAWCLHVDVIGADFKVHLRVVHGYDLEFAAMTRRFIVEIKSRFCSLVQCPRCYLRAITDDEMRQHVAQCRGRRQAARSVFIRGVNAGAFFARHAAELNDRKAREMVKSEPARSVRLWVARSTETGDVIEAIDVNAM